MATSTEMSVSAGRLGENAKDVSGSAPAVTVLGRDDMLQGRLAMGADGHILGQFQGEIECAGELVIGKEAEVAATIRGVNVSISGLVRGNVQVSGRLKLTSTGRLEGDAKVASLVVQEGAVHVGSIEVHPEGLGTGEPATIVVRKPAEAGELPSAVPATPAMDRVKKLWTEFF
jgi:cytoskeletal protein CcmA (bactofilin family)